MRLAVPLFVVLAASAAHAGNQDPGADAGTDDLPPETTGDPAPPTTTDDSPGTTEPAPASTEAAPSESPGSDADDGADDGDAARGTDKGTIGLGLIIGEPTGITAKLYLQDDQAIQGAAGFALLGSGLHIHADYVFHPAILQARDGFVLLAYVGPGVRLIQYRDGARGDSPSHLALGARGVGGLLFDFTQAPLDAFVEIAGVLEFNFGEDGGPGVALNAAAGARYYF